MQGFEKTNVKRKLLGLLQHVFALVISILIAVIVMNSYIIVDNMYGERIKYNIAFLENSEAFEESDIFTEMFRNSISDITQYAVIQEQMETDGHFDGTKHIDVTKYVNRKYLKSKSPITAVYSLENLIKWGRYGVELPEQRLPSKIEFLMFFEERGIDYLCNVLTELGEDMALPYTEYDQEADRR